MKPMIRSGLFLALCAGLTACASSRLRVDSQPEKADVLLSVDGQPPRKIGQTPYTGTPDAGAGAFQLTITKDGFHPQNVVVPGGAFERNTTVQVRLQEVASVRQEFATEQLQKVASSVADVQTLLRSKRFDEAEVRLTGLVGDYPSVATLHELLGTTLYLKKDLGKALASFRRAAELNPGNPDTRRMIDKIQGLRLPSGGER